jgi:hypothetical protein
MTIRVQLPDGNIGEFPDGMSDAQITDVLRKQFPPPQITAEDASKQLSDLTQAAGANQPNPEKVLFDRMPLYKQIPIAADDLMRSAANGMTFGYADKWAGALSGEGTEAERAKTAQAEARSGGAGTVANIGGSLLSAVGLAKNGLTLAGRLGTNAMTGAKGMLARTALMAPEGAAYGVLNATGNDTDLAEGAKLGAIGGAAGSVAGDIIGAGVSSMSKFIKGKPNIPELGELKQQARDAYKMADDAGIIIKPQGVQNLASDIQTELADFGYHPALQPRVAVVLDELNKAAQGNITLKGIDVIRRIADNARKSLDPSEKALGNKIIAKIDDFVGGISKNDVLAGDPKTGVNALQDARSLWGRVSKAERLQGALENAKNRAGTTGSGGNVDNAMRQEVKKLYDKGRGFSGDEREAMKEIMLGKPGQNILRLLGKLSPSGNGLMAALGVGGAMANPALGAASLGGMGAKWLADRGTQTAIEALDVLIRSGGSKQALAAAQGAFAKLTKTQRFVIGQLVTNMAIRTPTGEPQYQR